MQKTFTDYLKQSIREIITEYPSIGMILDKAGIGCTGCTLGTCPLGEIVNVHGLSAEQERNLLTEIASVLFPNEQVEIPLSNRNATVAKDICPPLRKMIHEHTFVIRLIDQIPKVVESIRKDGINEQLIRLCVEFIREYADGYHHAKEEAVLFTYFNGTQEIISLFKKEHETGRGFVRNILEGLENSNAEKIIENLQSYAGLLREHIHKEDTILFPWMNRTLSDNQVGLLFARCAEIDRQFERKAKEMEEFVIKLS